MLVGGIMVMIVFIGGFLLGDMGESSGRKIRNIPESIVQCIIVSSVVSMLVRRFVR